MYLYYTPTTAGYILNPKDYKEDEDYMYRDQNFDPLHADTRLLIFFSMLLTPKHQNTEALDGNIRNI